MMRKRWKVLVGTGAVLFALNVAIPYAAHLHLMKDHYHTDLTRDVELGKHDSLRSDGKILGVYEFRAVTSYNRLGRDGNLSITTRVVRPFLPYISATYWKLSLAPSEVIVSMYENIFHEVQE